VYIEVSYIQLFDYRLYKTFLSQQTFINVF